MSATERSITRADFFAGANFLGRLFRNRAPEYRRGQVFLREETASGYVNRIGTDSAAGLNAPDTLELQAAMAGALSSYTQRLDDRVRRLGNPVTVGLDPRWEQLPPQIVAAARTRPTLPEQVAAAFEQFCSQIIDVVASLVPAVKPQAAFFEEWGPPGCDALARVIRRARQAGLIVICDAKRGDIGSTAQAYANGYLAGADPDAAPWGADALTINPYLGRDTLEPFVRVATERGAGLYVLVRTSNPGAATFQDLSGSAGRTVYQSVAELVEELAQSTRQGDPYGAVGAVVGATYPQELNALRQVMPHVPLLIPGYGSQGGRATDLAGAFDSQGTGAVVNSSRGIIFAYERTDLAARFSPNQWEQAVEAATLEMIADLAQHTPAGKLRKGEPPPPPPAL